MSSETVEKSQTAVWQQKWFPWVIAALLAAAAGLLIWLALSQQQQKRDLESEMELLRETVTTLREEAAQKEEEERLIHEAVPVITNSLISEQLTALQELVTSEYFYTNSGKYTNQNQIKIIGKDINIPFTSKGFIVAYDGRITAGIDLSEVCIDVNETARTITVTLPKSEIKFHETIQDSLEVLDEKTNVFNPITIEDYNDFSEDQKAKMEEKAIERGILSNADAEAKRVIESFLSLIPGMDTYQLTLR